MRDISNAVAGLNNLAGKYPIIGLALRYWWVTLPAGAYIGLKVMDARKSGKHGIQEVIDIAIPPLALAASIIVLNEQAKLGQPAPAAAAPVAPDLQAAAQDAQYTLNQQPQQ
jgi:hypothetical protein